jgi:hypothetical protein
MNADPRELSRLHTFYVRDRSGGALRAAFVIDGRTYRSAEDVRADVTEAFDELQRRRLAAQYVTEPVTPDAPVPRLPSWRDYRATLAIP